MSILRILIDGAVADAIAEHPKYFTPRGHEKARAAIVRKIVAAFRDGGDEADNPETPPKEALFMFADPASREARGYVNLRRIAGAVPPRRDSEGRVVIVSAAYREAVFALSELPPLEQWPFLTEQKHVIAWREFFRDTLPAIVCQGIVQHRNGTEGIVMPGYWPPSKDGRMYDTPEAA